MFALPLFVLGTIITLKFPSARRIMDLVKSAAQRVLEPFSLEKGRLRGDFINVYKHLVGGNEGQGASLLSDSVVSGNKTRGNGHKLKCMKFHLNMRTTFLL